MQRSVARNVAWLAGAGAFALAALGVLCREEILVQNHLLRLRNEPGYLHRILASGKHSPGRAAIARLLESHPGQEALFREYVELILKPMFAQRENLAETVFEAVMWNTGETTGYVECFPARGLAIYGTVLRADRPERLAAINDLLPQLAGVEYRHADYPGLRFEMVPGRQARSMRFPGSILPDDPAWACWLRRDLASKVAVLTPLLKKAGNATQLRLYLEALGRLGPEARAAVPAIQEVLDVKLDGQSVRPAAEAALRSILGLHGNPVEF